MEEADSKETKRRRLLPCSSFTSDDDSLMETSHNVYEVNEIVEKSGRVEDSENKIIDPRVDADIQCVVSLIKRRKPVPLTYYNSLCPDDGGNVELRLDGLRPDFDYLHLLWMTPPALRTFVRGFEGPYSDGLNGAFGYVRFRRHEIAKNFLLFFNGRKFSEPDITYQLSWAPFKRYKCKNVDVYEEKMISNSDTEDESKTKLDTEEKRISESDAEVEAKTKLDTNSNSDSEADSDRDSEADAKYGSNSELNTNSGFTERDSDTELESEDEQFFLPKKECQASKAELNEKRKQYRELHVRLDKEFHESGASWPRPAVKECIRFHRGHGSSTLYLTKVDPLVDEKHMERIFQKYGQCSVNLPPGRCIGFVEFVERKSAEQAYKKLFFPLLRLHICILQWGYKKLFSCSKCQQPFGDSKDVEYVDFIREREEKAYLRCPFLGQKCTYPHTKLP